MRKSIQKGFLRIPLGIAAAVAGFLLLSHYWDALTAANARPLDAGQKIAFVAAAFSVTAYNLRTRVMDLILKISGRPTKVSHLCVIARQCGMRLTNLVILFTITAFLLGAGGFIPEAHWSARWYGAASAGLFAASLVQFVYVLFAFELLERMMLDDAEEKAKDSEAERLLKAS